MDQPINLPSQFISLRWRCVEIHRSKKNPFSGPEIMRNVRSLYTAESPCVSP